MKIISNIFYGLFIILLLGVAGLFLLPTLPLQQNISMKIVESGSMEPAIKTGSLVVVAPASSYFVGDIITFESTSADVPTTHRITETKEENGLQVFVTKGDANEEADTNVAKETAVIGKVLVAVPYAGFILDFARQPLGFGLLIVLPAIMIILGEIEKIWSEFRRKKTRVEGKVDFHPRVIGPDVPLKTKEVVRMIEIGRPIVKRELIPNIVQAHVASSVEKRRSLPFGEIAIGIGIVVVSICFTSMSFVGSTVSYFNDTELSEGNEFIAQLLDFIIEADGSVYNFLGSELDDEDGAIITVTPVLGSVDVAYEVDANMVSGSAFFCDSILAESSLPAAYTGQLINLSTTNVIFDAPWTLALSLPPVYGPFELGDMCVIDITYTAWNAQGDTGSGYSDEEVVTLVFHAPLPEVEGFNLFVEPEAILESPEEEENLTEEIVTPENETEIEGELPVEEEEIVEEEETPADTDDVEENEPEEIQEPVEVEEEIIEEEEAEEEIEEEETETEEVEEQEEVEETVSEPA